MKTLFATSAILAALATPVFAQDFAGGYVGGQLGAVSQPGDSGETLVFDRNLDGQFDDTVTTTVPSNAFSPGFCGGAATSTANSACAGDDDGIDGGIRAGYDWQRGSWVFGVVGELSSVDATNSVSGFSTTPASYTFTRETKWVAGARARAGYMFGPYLGYGTAGFAYADVDHSFTTSNGMNAFAPSSDDKLDGHQWGLGVERRFEASPWTVGVEYLRTTLDDGDYTVRVTQGTAQPTNPFVLAPNTTGTDIRRSEEDFEFDSVRLTVGYRF